MPRLDQTGPAGKGKGTGRGMGGCVTTEKQLEKSRGKGMGPCGNGTPKGGGSGNCGGRRRGENGITYFT